MSGQVRDARPMKKPASGGSSEMEANEPIVIPNGSSDWPLPVTITTPVGK